MGENLKILFLCPQPLWPVNTGARLRNFHLANALCSHAEVTVLHAVHPADIPAKAPASSFQNVLSAARGNSYTFLNILRGIKGPIPVTVLNYVSRNIEQALTGALKATAFDAVQMESIHMAPYLNIIRRQKPAVSVVLDWHNVESELIQQYAASTSNPARKFIATRTSALLYQMEQDALKSFSAHTVVSELERDKLLKRAPGAKIQVIPNGVDTAAFARRQPLPISASRQTLLFVGSMDYHANSEAVLWFCRDIWPQLAAEFTSLDFKIVGRNPPSSVQALASARILVTGTVEDVRPFYHEAFAVLVPLRVGGGTRLKILEAMAAGVPVISTRLGAEGIAAEDQKQILLADTPAAMAAAIRSLLTQPDLAPKLREAARILVETRYDWNVLGQKLATLYASLTDRHYASDNG
jgi:sugar transferase (PEP-CTERM/EpsH1 system associated)